MAPDISNPPGARNHSQQVLTDALATYSVYSQLAPSLNQEQLNCKKSQSCLQRG